MKKIGLILFILAAKIMAGQDVGAVDISSPVTGCVLTTAENVTAAVYNFGPNITTTIGVSYTINGGAPVMEFIPPLASLTSNNYTFLAKANLSAPGTYTISAYTAYPGDVNPANDRWNITIVNYPLSIGGSVSSNATVCSGSNNGTLTLSGNTGSVVNWQSSTDGGVSWAPIAVTTNTLSYTNILNTTMYRAVIQSGVCPPLNSGSATITTNSVSVGGVIAANTTVCSGSNSGTLTLSGYTGNILSWQSTTNGGSSWNAIANTSSTQNYNNIVSTTAYRSVIQNGVCPAVNSGTVTVTANPVSAGGTVAASTTVCSGLNSGTLVLSSYTGSVLNWESSVNSGVSWTPVANTTTGQNYTNLTSSTWYRAQVKSGVCAAAASTVAIVTVDPAVAVGGIVSPDTTRCNPLNTGTLTLSGFSGSISNWEYSTDNGVVWTSVNNTTPVLTYANLATTTWYRARVQNGVCPSAISAVALVVPASIGGTVSSNTTVCKGVNTGTLTLTGYVGAVLNWESSTNNGAFWTSISNTTTSQGYTDLTAPTWYRVKVKSASCPVDSSSPAKVSFYPHIVSAGNDTTIEFGSLAALNGMGGASYLWSPGGLVDNSTSAHPAADPTVTTTFTLFVIDLNGCSDTGFVRVKVVPGPFRYLISNLITLNGDGINDTWYIEHIEMYPASEIFIYNLNGQEIYHAAPYLNEWAGTYKGTRVQDGDYYYILKFNDTGKIYKGTITIVSEK